ncbi:hypothetical protein [Piscinibacter gummiphilus]|uniref:Uncharacterized protein n=1 Tax=Piscinibacter gummiphilus TaxID=946333 RepID=A0ABZ0CUS3_9BURK|nr:hypothetical protein [Piscinibacter gummiphilus]WOB06881.1 hypothetical protein RXV79_18385 [Piscinibacter gummiphilus]
MQVKAAISSIEKCLREASNHFLSDSYGEPLTDDDEAVASYYIERAFIELLVLVEHLNLPSTYRRVESLLEQALKDGLTKSKMGSDEPYLVWAEKLRMFVDGLSELHGLGETDASEMRDIKSILRRAVYMLCDTTLFADVPKKESEVHARIEGILKCHYQDLKSKPALSKPIKKFEPDSAIPSIKTLIEYKFITSKAEAKRVADEILADVSGYRSPDWRNLLFVIYETERVMHEDEWTALLQECGLGRNYDAIVLSGSAKAA